MALLAQPADGDDPDLMPAPKLMLPSPRVSTSSNHSELSDTPNRMSAASAEGSDMPLQRRPTTPASPRTVLGLPEGFLRTCASRWPHRSGGRALQRAAGHQAYEKLLAAEISEEDAEQISIDVERSTVDGLEELYPPSLDDEALAASLSRLLTAWCSRHPNGYCQGMNFVAMVLLVVMQRGYGVWGEAGTRRAEEQAFWTFAAMMELVLPEDFYWHPHMPGLQRDVRVLFHLFELARSDEPSRVSELEGWHDADTGWKDILRLSAYKWFVPCYVNMLPLHTLLLFWDRLLLAGGHGGAAAVAAAKQHTASGGHGGSSATPHIAARAHYGRPAAHLLLAIALIRTALDASRHGGLDLQARPEEGLGLGFNQLLEVGLHQTDAGALLSLASSFEVSSAQLAYLRTRLEDAPPPPAKPSASGSARGRSRPVEPSLSPLQVTTLRLMSPRRSDPLPIRLLKQTLLLCPPPPLPIAAAELSSFPYFPRLVSTCAVTGVAFGVWALRTVARPVLSRVPILAVGHGGGLRAGDVVSRNR